MMRRVMLVLAAMASPLAAQNAPSRFEAARTAPLAIGQWTYAATPTGSEARLGARLIIRCDRIQRRVALRRIEMITATPPPAMIVTTDLGTHTVPVGGTVANTDRLLDAIAFSRGRFVVEGGGSNLSLVAPTSPEAARIIEDCRN